MKLLYDFTKNRPAPVFILIVIEIAAICCLCWLLYNFLAGMSELLRDSVSLFFKNKYSS
jgi:hypothetical protein